MKQEHPTLDGATFYRCMLVAFDDASAKTCTRAVSPLSAVRVEDVREACAKVSEILPLIVLHPENTPAVAASDLADLAGACGAELLSVALPVDASTLGRRILEALNKAEARRVVR